MNHFGLFNKVLNFSAERYFRTAGDMFIYEGKYETALYMVNKTLNLEPENVRALVLKGDILFCLNKDSDALENLDSALQLDSTYAEAYISKAGVLDVMGKHYEALNCCRSALKYIKAKNDFLLPSLFDQYLALLVRLRKYREAQQLLYSSKTQLNEKDYDYLLSMYETTLYDRCKTRTGLHQRAEKLTLRVISNPSKANDPAPESTCPLDSI